MNKTKWQSYAGWAGLALCLFLMAGSVHAMFDPFCGRSADIEDLITGAVLCQDSATNNDDAATVNAELFFGEDDWVYLSKQDTPGSLDEAVDIDWTVECTGGCASQAGTWSFNADVWATYEDVMIVMKGSDMFSGFLLGMGTSSGDWDTLGPPDLSHLTVYARMSEGGSMVPEPTTLSLLALGLVGAGYSRKRKSV